jgi:hypothetical protein
MGQNLELGALLLEANSISLAGQVGLLVTPLLARLQPVVVEAGYLLATEPPGR